MRNARGLSAAPLGGTKHIPEPFDVEKCWEGVNHILQKYGTRQGIEVNDHRELLVVEKR